MSYKVVYFTRTGTSKRVAEKIADKISSRAVQITDNVNWKGIFGFLKAGYYASTNKKVDIKIHDNIYDTDEIIVVTPLWAGKITPTINTFLKTKNLKKIHLIVTSNGSKIKNRSGFKSGSDIVKKESSEEIIINNFTNSLLKVNKHVSTRERRYKNRA